LEFCGAERGRAESVIYPRKSQGWPKHVGAPGAAVGYVEVIHLFSFGSFPLGPIGERLMKAFLQVLWAGAIVLALWPQFSDAATIRVQLSSADSPIVPGELNQGWWSDTIPQRTGNEGSGANYFTGFLSTSPSNTSRGFFTFQLASITQQVLSARLLIPSGTTQSPDASETVGVFEVSTAAAALSTKNRLDLSIYDDLGSGALFGSAVIEISRVLGPQVEIDLNSAAISALNSSRGDYFSIGLSLLTLRDHKSASEFIFGSTRRPGTLELTLVPEPSTFANVSFIGLLAVWRLLALRGRPRLAYSPTWAASP
jgi:hypothetical protein